MRTSNATVVDFQITLEFLVARADPVERRFDHFHRAAASARATSIQKVQHVGETTHEAEVSLDAAAEPHSTVQSRRHQDHLVVGTSSVECLVIAVLLRAAERRRLRQLEGRLLLQLPCTRKHCVIARQVSGDLAC